MTRFKWTLPEGVDPRFLEHQLFMRGSILFYFDDRFDKFMAVRYAQNGYQNVYDNPTKFNTLTVNGYDGIELTDKEAVPIWSNYVRTPEIDMVMNYSRILTNLDISLEITSKNLRLTRVVTVEDSQRLTFMNLLRNVDKGDPVVFGTNGLNLTDGLNVLDMSSSPQAVAALRLEKNQVWNEAMTMLGIDNANQDKKERLTDNEVEANGNQVMAAREAAMVCRRQACEKINKRWPEANISVEWNLDYEPPENSQDDQAEDDSEDEDEE